MVKSVIKKQTILAFIDRYNHSDGFFLHRPIEVNDLMWLKDKLSEEDIVRVNVDWEEGYPYPFNILVKGKRKAIIYAFIGDIVIKEDDTLRIDNLEYLERIDK